MTPAPATATGARERLIVAAQELFAERGVAATTPRQVLQRSGVGQGSLYHHFPTKQDLANAAVGRTAEQQLQAAELVLESALDAPDRIETYLRRDRDAVAGCRIGRLTADPTVMGESELFAHVENYFSELISLLRGVLEEAGLAPARAHDRATALVAVVQGGYVLARATGDPERMRSAVRGMLDLLEGAKDE